MAPGAPAAASAGRRPKAVSTRITAAASAARRQPRRRRPRAGPGSTTSTTTSRSEISAREETMGAQGVVVPPGGGRIWHSSPGRSEALKLLGAETGDSVMMFEETAPAGIRTTYHRHHDSDEVAYVLAGEITFKIGDEVGAGGA